jgi:hypothetical protein
MCSESRTSLHNAAAAPERDAATLEALTGPTIAAADPKPAEGLRTSWATVDEAAAHFRRSAWFIRKTANEMSRCKFDRHPIKAGRDWLIDLEGMTLYFGFRAERDAAQSCYPVSDLDGRLAAHAADEDWGW